MSVALSTRVVPDNFVDLVESAVERVVRILPGMNRRGIGER